MLVHQRVYNCDYLDHILSILSTSSSWSHLRAEIFNAGQLASIFWCPQLVTIHVSQSKYLDKYT